MFHYTFHKVGLDGSLSNRAEINADELDVFMQTTARQFATVQIVRSDGKGIVYTDNGQEWEIVERFTVGE